MPAPEHFVRRLQGSKAHRWQGKFARRPHRHFQSLENGETSFAGEFDKLASPSPKERFLNERLLRFQFTVPSAVVLTVNAYSLFAKTREVSGVIEEFLESSKMADMAALKTASDKCVSAISYAPLPEPIKKLVGTQIECHRMLGFIYRGRVRRLCSEGSSDRRSYEKSSLPHPRSSSTSSRSLLDLYGI